MKIVDVTLILDGLHLQDDESVEDVIRYISQRYHTAYEIQIGDIYEESVDDD